MNDLGALYTRIEADTSGLAKAETHISSFAKNAAGYFAGIASVAAIGQAIKTVTMATARYDTLGVVMNNVGKNAGYSAKEMAEYEKQVQKTGISMTSTRETLTKLAQAQIDLSKSTDLARIAQDAAVIGNIDSSEAFERMINGIRAGEVEILRNIGLNVNFEDSYQELAATLGKTSGELTNYEKTQARVSAVVKEGAKIQGTYEAAMGAAGKKWTSLNRHVSNAQVLLGRLFQPSFGTLVDKITEKLKSFNDSLDDKTIKQWGEGIDSALKKTLAFFEGIQSLSNILETPGIGQLAIIGGVLARFGPQAAIASAGVLTLNNALEQTQTGSLQQGVSAYNGFAKSIQNLLDVAAGTRDFSSGAILTEVDKIERRLQELRNYKAPWQLFPDKAETARQAEAINAEIKRLESTLMDAKIKDAIKEGIEDPWRSAEREAMRAGAATANAVKASAEDQAESLKTLQKKYEEHANRINEINDQIKQNQMSGQELLRDLGRTNMDDFSAWNDMKAEAEEYEQAAIKALQAAQVEKDSKVQATLFEDAITYAEKAQDKFVDLNREVKNGDQTMVSSSQATAEAIAGVERLIALRDEALRANKQVEVSAANSIVEQSGGKIGAMFAEVEAKSTDLVMNKFPAVEEGWGRIWINGQLVAEETFAATSKSLDQIGVKLKEVGSIEATQGVNEEIIKIGETYTTAFTQAQKSSGQASVKMVGDVKEVSKEGEGFKGVWKDVFSEAEKASDAARRKMIEDINAVKKAASNIEYSVGGSVGRRFGGPIQKLKNGGEAIKASVGRFFSGYGGGDRIPILGEAGEFMLRKEAVRAGGKDTASAFNRGDWGKVVSNLSKKLQLGGPVSPVFPAMALAGGGSVSNFHGTGESSRSYYIQGEIEPITVRATDREADRLYYQLNRKYKRRSS